MYGTVKIFDHLLCREISKLKLHTSLVIKSVENDAVMGDIRHSLISVAADFSHETRPVNSQQLLKC